MIGRVLVFLVINFAALGLGGLFTGKGVASDWYATLNKAPWTPPGWVFGAAWTTIMIFFAFYMAFLWPLEPNKKMLTGLFGLQFALNVLWNPVFFHFQNTGLGLILILGLTGLLLFLLIHYLPSLKWKSSLIFPYVIWMLIATSLNAYAYLKN